jgi:hypothetical protein
MRQRLTVRRLTNGVFVAVVVSLAAVFVAAGDVHAKLTPIPVQQDLQHFYGNAQDIEFSNQILDISSLTAASENDSPTELRVEVFSREHLPGTRHATCVDLLSVNAEPPSTVVRAIVEPKSTINLAFPKPLVASGVVNQDDWCVLVFSQEPLDMTLVGTHSFPYA